MTDPAVHHKPMNRPRLPSGVSSAASAADPRLPSLQLVAILGVFAASLIYLSGQSLNSFPTLERLSESLPTFLSNVTSLVDDALITAIPTFALTTGPPTDGRKTPYRCDDYNSERLALTRLSSTAFQAHCPRTTRAIRLIFPHVNKAGGRTIEGTFNPLVISNSFLTQESRSRRRITFELVDGHQDYLALALSTGCGVPSRRCASNLKYLPDSCSRWIFMMRDPLARTLSAFYTSVGPRANTKQSH